MRPFLREFWLFGMKQARACIFAGTFFLLLFVSKHVPLFGLARYDFLFLAALTLQIILVATRIESTHELMTLCAFHLLGMAMELFKTQPHIASWTYPEDAFFKIGTVPLYSGFMYAAVASYMCQAWRLLNLELVGYPSYWWSIPLALAIYGNFFTRHWLPDARWVLMVLVFAVFWRTRVYFTPAEKRRKMPLVLSFALIGFFIWIAENVCTYLGGWVYAEQRGGWTMVSLRLISSWFLLVIVSFIIVADLKHGREAARSRLPLPESALQSEGRIVIFP